jgi:hypothetical protein
MSLVYITDDVRQAIRQSETGEGEVGEGSDRRCGGIILRRGGMWPQDCRWGL